MTDRFETGDPGVELLDQDTAVRLGAVADAGVVLSDDLEGVLASFGEDRLVHYYPKDEQGNDASEPLIVPPRRALIECAWLRGMPGLMLASILQENAEQTEALMQQSPAAGE